jgi:hypothetical protein
MSKALIIMDILLADVIDIQLKGHFTEICKGNCNQFTGVIYEQFQFKYPTD